MTDQWLPAGNLGTARLSHTATLLTDGKVLVAGGYDYVSSLASAELYLTDALLLDGDGDGCTTKRELGPSASLGGRRNPKYFWDFYDVWTHPSGNPTGWQRDKVVTLFGDIFGVASRFNESRGSPPTKQEGLTEALTPPTSDTGYHAAFDRGPRVGPNAWDLGPPDGLITLFGDIFGVTAQFNHNCT